MDEKNPPTKAPVYGSPKKPLKTSSERPVAINNSTTFKRIDRFVVVSDFFTIEILLSIRIANKHQKVNKMEFFKGEKRA